MVWKSGSESYRNDWTQHRCDTALWGRAFLKLFDRHVLIQYWKSNFRFHVCCANYDMLQRHTHNYISLLETVQQQPPSSLGRGALAGTALPRLVLGLHSSRMGARLGIAPLDKVPKVWKSLPGQCSRGSWGLLKWTLKAGWLAMREPVWAGGGALLGCLLWAWGFSVNQCCVWFIAQIRALINSLTITSTCCQDVKHKTLKAILNQKSKPVLSSTWLCELHVLTFWLWGSDSAINVIFLMFWIWNFIHASYVLNNHRLFRRNLVSSVLFFLMKQCFEWEQ